jgi:hypothetical protein
LDIYIHVFLKSALVGGEWSASHPGRFIADTHWIGGWVGPRTSRDDVENRKISPRTGLEIGTLGLPASSSHHTDCIIPATIQDVKLKKKKIYYEFSLPTSN